MIPCIDLYIPDTRVASEAHTHTNTRVQHFVPASRARTQRWAWVRAIRTCVEIFTSLRSYITLSQEYCQIFVVGVHAARHCTNTHTHTHTHTHTSEHTHARVRAR
jgi:hypothetical protein